MFSTFPIRSHCIFLVVLCLIQTFQLGFTQNREVKYVDSILLETQQAMNQGAYDQAFDLISAIPPNTLGQQFIELQKLMDMCLLLRTFGEFEDSTLQLILNYEANIQHLLAKPPKPPFTFNRLLRNIRKNSGIYGRLGFYLGDNIVLENVKWQDVNLLRERYGFLDGLYTNFGASFKVGNMGISLGFDVKYFINRKNVLIGADTINEVQRYRIKDKSLFIGPSIILHLGYMKKKDVLYLGYTLSQLMESKIRRINALSYIGLTNRDNLSIDPISLKASRSKFNHFIHLGVSFKYEGDVGSCLELFFNVNNIVNKKNRFTLPEYGFYDSNHLIIGFGFSLQLNSLK